MTRLLMMFALLLAGCSGGSDVGEHPMDYSTTQFLAAAPGPWIARSAVHWAESDPVIQPVSPEMVSLYVPAGAAMAELRIRGGATVYRDPASGLAAAAEMWLARDGKPLALLAGSAAAGTFELEGGYAETMPAGAHRYSLIALQSFGSPFIRERSDWRSALIVVEVIE